MPGVCAIESSTSPGIIRVLLDCGSPNVFSRPNKDGNNLFHYVQRDTPVEVVTLLVERTPGLLLSSDSEGIYPYLTPFAGAIVVSCQYVGRKLFGIIVGSSASLFSCHEG